MISPQYVRAMAGYNRRQNDSIYTAASSIDDADRRRDRGAFFGSIHATLNHLLWADRIWMNRLAGTPPAPGGGIPGSTTQHQDWAELEAERRTFDEVILGWADGIVPSSLEGDLTWFSGAMNTEVTRPRWLLVAHMFNHQTHHRGQVHCMLTALGARPDDTDLPFRNV